MMRKKLSVRANNVISDKIKVNDLRGNPIEMAAQVVWRVTDTAQALFDVDDYKERSEEHTSELQSLMRISYAVFCLKKTLLKIYSDYISARSTRDISVNNIETHAVQDIIE